MIIKKMIIKKNGVYIHLSLLLRKIMYLKTLYFSSFTILELTESVDVRTDKFNKIIFLLPPVKI